MKIFHFYQSLIVLINIIIIIIIINYAKITVILLTIFFFFSFFFSARSSRQTHCFHGHWDLSLCDVDPSWEPWIPHPVIPCGVQEIEERQWRVGGGCKQYPSLSPLSWDNRPGKRWNLYHLHISDQLIKGFQWPMPIVK